MNQIEPVTSPSGSAGGSSCGSGRGGVPKGEVECHAGGPVCCTSSPPLCMTVLPFLGLFELFALVCLQKLLIACLESLWKYDLRLFISAYPLIKLWLLLDSRRQDSTVPVSCLRVSKRFKHLNFTTVDDCCSGSLPPLTAELTVTRSVGLLPLPPLDSLLPLPLPTYLPLLSGHDIRRRNLTSLPARRDPSVPFNFE